ncbi:receptor-type tyrosine-protein phosphatase eta [Mixophyes fleayi]|uniref:receptor-type tyrosine-protein phosphatase eta n=1 Tax=Mixophyes fleayi TaxID=3061075 RepID=UPI003F4E2198
MTNVTKSYNITYGNSSSSTWTVSSNTTNVTLQSLTSGTSYTISVVTVGVWGYQSLPVSASLYTKPMPVKSLMNNTSSMVSVSLFWSRPDEYQSTYTYRVQTNVTSPATMINNTLVINESATIMDLIPGETYTFMVYTRAADNVTESDPVSVTTCTVPGLAGSITLNNYKLSDFLGVTWTAPAGKVDYYTVSLTGDINITKQTNSTQVNITGLLPGREYRVTVQTLSSNCSQTSAPVTEATYPSPPGALIFNTIGTNNITLSWGEPDNMTNVTKSYNITYGNSSSSTWTVLSNITTVTLQSLTSGTNYTITVVTVGVRGYLSLPVSGSVYTKPMPVKSLMYNPPSMVSVPLSWSRPDEYQSTYTYRIQTNVTSSATMINNTLVINESATIMSLTPGETYTFLVYTRAADNVTESDLVSVTTCTVPGLAGSITLNNYKLSDLLGVTWTAPAGKVDSYTVNLTGDINNTTQTNSTQVNITGLLPGREYTVTVQTLSGNCSQTSAPVTEATYPSPPVALIFNTIRTNNITLSWGEPVNMIGVIKSYNITYGNSSSSTWTVLSDTANVTLQSLTSGTNYTITVVTVGVRGYQSLPVSRSVYTNPMSVKLLMNNPPSMVSVPLFWNKPDEYQSSYTYRVQTNVTSPATIVTSESATIMSLTPGATYTFLVYTRAADGVTESAPVSLTTCTVPAPVPEFTCTPTSTSLSFTWGCPEGIYTGFMFAVINRTTAYEPYPIVNCNSIKQTYVKIGLNPYTNYTVNLTTLSCEKSSDVVQMQCQTLVAAPIQPTMLPIVTPNPPSYNTIVFTFSEFDNSNGPIKYYAVIVSGVNVEGQTPSSSILSKTYNDYKNKNTNAYVAKIVNMPGRSRRSISPNPVTVTIGDSTGNGPYVNGPLEPLSSYWIGIAGFTSIAYDGSGTIVPQQSLCTFAPYSGAIVTPQNPSVIIGAVVGCILGILVIICIIGFFIWRKRRNGGEKKAEAHIDTFKSMKKSSQSMSTISFPRHFEKQSADSNLGFSEEYEKFGRVGVAQSKKAAENPDNREKNRYTNVLPYDASRVILSSPGNPANDYINANFIPGYSHSEEFIAAQGPLPQTLNDFWRMIWEKDVRAIVMLTRCVELGKVKCEEYWPTRSSRVYENLSVAMTNEAVLPDWTTRDFTVTDRRSRQHKQVRHFHFTAWPDHGVPKTTNDLIQFRNLIRDYTTRSCPAHSPILVHCSAGVGRTGTLIALDRIMKQVEDTDMIDVFGIVHDLRMHRGLMVQTETQYVFLNQCALDFINQRKLTDPDLIYQNASAIYENIASPSMKKTNV